MFESKFFNVLCLFFSFVIICPIFLLSRWLEGGGDRKNHALHNYYLTSLRAVRSTLQQGVLDNGCITHTIIENITFLYFFALLSAIARASLEVWVMLMDTFWKLFSTNSFILSDKTTGLYSVHGSHIFCKKVFKYSRYYITM